MASTFTLTSKSYEGRYLQLKCTQKTNVATNKSTITWELSSIGGSANYYSIGPTSVNINGTQVYYCARKNWDTKEFPASKGSVSGSIVVDHNGNGSKQITVSMSTAIYVGTISSYSDTWTLDNIPRQATITSSPDFTDLQNPVIYYSNPAGTAVDSLMACISFTGAVDDIAYRDISKTDTSYTFPLTDAERNLLRNNTPNGSRDVIFFVRTYIGGNRYLSTDTKKFTVVETEDTKPSVSMTASLDNGSLPSKFSGLCIQGKSKFNVNLSAEGKYSAGITSLYATVDGKTYNSTPFTTDVIQNSGNIVGYAKDTRGFTRTVSEPINVVPYSKPWVIPIESENSILCYRSDGNGKRVGNSTSLWIKAKRSYYSVSGKNQCALQWRSKLATEQWNDTRHPWNNLLPKSNTSTNNYDALISNTVFDLKTSYTVQIGVFDDVGENDIKTFDIPTQDVALHLGKGGKNVSVGTYCDYSKPYTFYSDWDAYFDKDVYFSGNKLSEFFIERGTKVINGITWTYRKYSSGDVMCEAVLKMEGCTDITAFTGQDYSYKALTFPFEFDGMPNINLTGISTAGKDVYGNIAYSVRDYTSTGFNIQQTCKASVKEAWVSVFIIGKLK